MRRWVGVLALVLAVGCGDAGGGPDLGALDTGRDPGAADAGPDVPMADPGNADTGGRDGATGEVAEDVPAQQEVILTCQEEGGFGCPCARNSDCNSSFCIDTMDGLRCTASCQDEDGCPPGWLCGVVGGSGPDVSYGCIDPFSRLCQPCVSDTDCIPQLGVMTGKYACIERGDDGSFCGVPCASNAACPYGYECGIYVIDGVNQRQCRPKGDGPCPCTDKYRDLGYTTVCHRSNVFGRCAGERTCDAECSARWPDAESCNAVDDDCNGLTDDALISAACDITNALGTCKGTTTCVFGKIECAGDEAVPETCNAKDDDCNGIVDDENTDGCIPHYLDMDNDGFGIVEDQKCLCGPKGNYRATKPGDCNDDDIMAYPGANEVCNGQDDNCDNRIDEMGAQGCINYYRDDDKDGRGVDGDVRCMCEGARPYTATLAGDCKDNDDTVFPGNTEVCNGKDDNCVGGIDEDDAEGCTVWFMDNDRDGSGNTLMSRCMCKKIAGSWDAPEGGDCNDNNFNIRPGRTEICNEGVDDDCDGQADAENTLGCVFYCMDADDDGFGNEFDRKCLCAPVGKYDTRKCGQDDLNKADCNDNDAQIFPGAAERCATMKDDNCDGNINEAGAVGCTVYYLDKDGDGYGTNGSGQCLCAPKDLQRGSKDGDCNDNDFTINPGAQERCGGVDENCNGVFDDEGADGCRDYYLDEDGDQYGAEGTQTKCYCQPTGNYRGLYPGDCCDIDGRVFWGQSAFFTSKSACNSFDFNCDGQAELQYPTNGVCSGTFSCTFRPGFREGAIPGCGISQSNFLYDCIHQTLSCDDKVETRTQGCR